MTGYVFKRYELKYLLTAEQYAAVKKEIESRLVPDAFGKNVIQSLYYDTPDYRLIRESIEKPVFKEKLRLRCYNLNVNDKDVYLEMKRKYDGVVYKRRISCKESEADSLFSGKVPSSQIGKELSYFISFYGDLRPKILILYDREAFFDRSGDLRVTFDKNILYRTDNLNFRLLPMTVAAVIAIVNGNLGVGVAIAGAFGLVRFRSAPGTAREIAAIFIAMASGLAFGTGYLAYGAIFLTACGIILFAFALITEKKKNSKVLEKIIKITIPETLDYTTAFDDVFSEYTVRSELEKVKSVNMGSMFRLSYRVTLKNADCEKNMLDAIRIRNGNLEILCSRADLVEKEL